MNSNPPAARRLPRSFYLPYPELVEPAPHDGAWAVADSRDHEWLPSNGATDKSGKRIFVPLESGAAGVSRHELAHVRWSPERFPRVRFPQLLLQAVEDARINLGLAKIGLPVTLDREQAAHIAHLAACDAKRGDLTATIVRAIASLGTEAEAAMTAEIEALPPHAEELAWHWVESTERRLNEASERVGEPVAPFRVALAIARELARDLKARGLLRAKLEIKGMACCHVAPGEGTGDGDEIPAFLRGKRSRYERMLAASRRRGEEIGLEPGRMKLSRPPLLVRQPKVLRSGVGARRAATEGTRIVRPDRLLLDRAIFERSGGRGGGTILVDTSGSMSTDASQVESMVRAAGGTAVVAIYSGRVDEGELRIVARSDWRADSDQFEPFGSGNIVDLPALDWLARQPAPRLWLSDGGVTGIGDECCALLLAKCSQVVERAGIQRVDDTAAAVKALA